MYSEDHDNGVEMRTDTLHANLLRAVIHEPLTEEEALLWMVLLHSHRVQLRLPLAADAPGITEFAALTLRGAAATVAALWPDRGDERASYLYWYWAWNSNPFPETVSDMPAELRRRVMQLRDRIAAHPDVADVSAEP